MTTVANVAPFRIGWSGRSLDYNEEEIKAVVDVMRQGDPLTQGKHLADFEAKFGRYHGFENCFGVTSCASALELSAVLTRIGPGDEVIMPAHTYCASAIPFGRTGAKLIWADIDPKTWLMEADSIRKLMTPHTKAIVVVHLYGLMASMAPIMRLASEHGCLVVEDCAQALGAEDGGRKSGAFGDIACYSFHCQKNITTLGEGGMLHVKSKKLAALVPGLRHNGHTDFPGERRNYWQPAMSNVDIDIPGIWPFNYSLGEAQCALGAKLLDRVDSLNDLRRRRAEAFQAAMADFPELVFQARPTDRKHAQHLLPARYDGAAFGYTRDDFIELMAYEYRIKVIVQYYPLYRYPLFEKMGFGAHDCPETDRLFDNMVSFPLHHWMSESDFEYMIDSSRRALLRLRDRK